MGNYFSNEQVYQRLERLENLDLNKNGVISKEEFEIWKNTDLENIKENLKNDIRREYKLKVKELNKEIDSLKSINDDLEKSLKDKNELIGKLGENITDSDDVKQLVDMLSKEQINKYVEDLLADENTNIKYLPDFVEKQIYRNIFKLSIKLINKIMNSTSFEIVNHKLHISMIPHDTA